MVAAFGFSRKAILARRHKKIYVPMTDGSEDFIAFSFLWHKKSTGSTISRNIKEIRAKKAI